MYIISLINFHLYYIYNHVNQYLIYNKLNNEFCITDEKNFHPEIWKILELHNNNHTNDNF